MHRVALLWVTAALAASVLGAGGEVPADTVLEVRLLEQVASHGSKPGTPVRAMLAAPVRSDGKTLIPAGVKVSGVLRQARPVGWGLVRETARLQIDFNELELPGGTLRPLKTRLVEVDNAREKVDRQGRVRGIRSTGTWAHKTSSRLAGWAMIDPVFFVFTQVTASRMLRFADPEIILPPGTDLLIRLLEPIEVAPAAKSGLLAVTRSEEERERLAAIVRDIPYRSRTEKTDRPSDYTNLLFIGSGGALERAFTAAGWVGADKYRASTAFQALRSFTENQGYQNAPMSTLLLDGRAPDVSLSKTLNTIAKRHHVRIWSRAETWKGNPILAASATHDIGIVFAPKGRMLTHIISGYIDHERAKIINDLDLTGCVEAAELVPRPWAPGEARTATGDRLITDGAMAVVQLNACHSPRRTGAPAEGWPPAPTASAFKRGVRETSLTLRNDVVRGNLAWQAAAGAHLLIRYLSGKTRISPPARATDVAGEASSAADSTRPGGSEDPAQQDLPPAAQALLPDARPWPAPAAPAPGRWEPALFEIGLHGGSLSYPSRALDTVAFSFEAAPNAGRVGFGLANLLGPGWAAGGSVTLNNYRWFSNELGFTRQRGKYRLGTFPLAGANAPAFAEQASGLLARQFHYNLLAHARPREARLRPYFAAGSVLQLVHLTGAPLRRADGPFRYGLKNIGMIRAAYNFGSAPPLDGGGIFQFAFQYGAGVKYRFHPRWLVRFDFRETIGRQPNFFPTPGENGEAAPDGVTVTHPRLTGAFRQQRLTLGLSFVF